MKPGLFTNFASKDDKEKTRSKSISSLKSLKLKQIKPNPNLNKVSNLSRIYANDHTSLTKNLIETFSPSNSKVHDVYTAGKVLTSKKSNSKVFISAKSELTVKKNIYKKRSPIASSRTKHKNSDIPNINIEESLSTTINSSNFNGATGFGLAHSRQKPKFCRFLSTSTLEKLSKDQSVGSIESFGGDFKSKVSSLFERFKTSHYEILGKYKTK